MKKITFMLMGILLAAMPLSAQNYRNSRYYNPRTDHLDYGYHQKDAGTPYYGFRIGPAFSYVNSDDKRLDGGNWQTGLNVGAVAGIPLSNSQPLYLETGLWYIEKGGKKNLDNGKKMTYDLNYLEIPVVLKYKYNIDPHFSIQPQLGGYLVEKSRTSRIEKPKALSTMTTSKDWMVVFVWAAAWHTTCSTAT